MGLPLWERVNSGLDLMVRPSVSLDLAETFLERCSPMAREFHFLEQTFFAVAGSAWNRGGKLPGEYEISWTNLRRPGAICRRYVGPFKNDALFINGRWYSGGRRGAMRNQGKISMTEANQYQHNVEIHENRLAWEKKKTLRMAYARLYAEIAAHLEPKLPGLKLELGSGMGNIKQHIPDCITSDLFPNPWLDRVENAYELNFSDGSIGHLILFDVWHHLEYPASALLEARRVLVPGGKIILMEPAMSLVGRLIYGNCHHELLGFDAELSDLPMDISAPEAMRYFAAQSSAHRIFINRELPGLLLGWNVCCIRQITSFAYLGSGGFRGPRLYPDFAAPAVRFADSVLGLLPDIFAARILIVLTKQ